MHLLLLLAAASIHGHIYAIDTGQPIAGAHLTIERQTPRESFDLMSAADGSYELTGLEMGRYRVMCVKRDYVPASFGEKKPGYGVTFLEPKSGAATVADIYLTRAVAITGRVIDEEGEPLPGVNVHISTRAYLQGKPLYRDVTLTTTDDRGVYRAHSLFPDRYYVQAEKGLGTANVFGPSEARFVQPSAGTEATNIDFTAPHVEVFSITGRIEDGGGRPVVAENINMYASQSTLTFGSTTRTDTEGVFHANNLTAALYAVVFYTNSSESMKRHDRVIDLRNAASTQVVFHVGAGSTVHGQLRAEGGELPKNLHVVLNPRTDSLMGRTSADSRVNDDGVFELAGLQPGRYDLVAYTSPHNADLGFFVSRAMVGDRDVTEEGLLVGESEESIPLTATLDFRGATVTGRVLDESDQPAPRTSVVLTLAGGARQATDRYQRWSVSEKDGKYQLSGIIPGDYLLMLWPDDDPLATQDPELLALLERHAVPLTLKESGKTELDLRLTAALRELAKSVY